jgi:uncharacterized protein YqfA (UPF0365 family)
MNTSALNLLAQSSSWNPIATVVIVIIIIILLVVFAVLFNFIGLYIRAYVSGARVSLFDLIGMRLRRVNAIAIVNSRIQARRAGIHV